MKKINKQLKKNIVEGDVFDVSWKESSYMDDHCFEATLIANIDEGKMMFVDTYWGINGLDNKSWDYTKMNKLFNFKFYCNLNDLKKIEEYDREYYDDKDLFRLTNQHACVPSCIDHYIKKGSKRSSKKMLKVLDEKIDKAKREIKYNTDRVGEYSAKKQEIINGNKEIYI